MIFIKPKKRNYIFFILHCLVAILLCSVYLNMFISPKKMPYLGMLALFVPILFILNLLFTFIWLIKREIVFIPFLIIVILSLFSIRKYIHFGGDSNKSKVENVKTEQGSRIKVLSYNIKYANQGKYLRDLEKFVIDQNVDIAFFQEIYTRQWRSEETFLAYRYNAVFDLVSISSKYPIINKQKIILPDNAYACLADIQINKDIIRCINVYLEPMFLSKNIFRIKKLDETKDRTKAVAEKLSIGFKKHETQIDLLAKYIKESPYPTIVAGDFNAVPLSYEYFTMKEGLIDVFEVSGVGLGMTFYDYFYPIRIDYIFSSEDFISKKSYVNKKVNFSDHYPILSTLQLNTENEDK